MTVARFWREQKNRYNLLGTKCGNCSKIFFPPEEICSDCHRKSIGKMEGTKLCGDGKIISYYWDFGDGSNSSDITPSHKFNDSGTYLVTLIVTDDKNNTYSKSIYVEIESLSEEKPEKITNKLPLEIIGIIAIIIISISILYVFKDDIFWRFY